MRISIFGLGYVGAVSGACFVRLGHEVVGVDPDEHKLEFFRSGRSPILEPGLEPAIAEAVADERFRVTADPVEAVRDSELSMICVGTPSLPDGRLSTDYVARACEHIGAAIRDKGSYHSVVVRSTVLPGTTQGLLAPLLERAVSGRAGSAFGISMNPEFLREGTALEDFRRPPFTIVGSEDEREARRVAELYAGVEGETVLCPTATAEATKYACNIFHAVKITVANEIGILCNESDIDARRVMDVVCRDDKLNISKRYLRPGYAFGGSCLPKDLRAFTADARRRNRPLLMLEAVLASNRLQIEQIAQRIMAHGTRKIGLLGLSFKEATDDLRESPLVSLAERLIGRGYDLRIFDPNVEYAALHGSNKRFIDEELPHLKSLLGSSEQVLGHAQLVIFGHAGAPYRELLARIRPDQTVFDLAGVAADERPGSYEGLYW